MSAAKQEVQALLNKLPDDCSLENVQYQVTATDFPCWKATPPLRRHVFLVSIRINCGFWFGRDLQR